jgi:hypothetical protein
MIARTASNLLTKPVRRLFGRPLPPVQRCALGHNSRVGPRCCPHRRPGLIPPGAGDLELQQGKRRVGGGGRRPFRACRYVVHPQVEGD